jgi:hypothetical protein
VSAINAYPLAWPPHRPRTAPHLRTWSKFKTTFGKARDECLGQIRTLGGREAIISTNLPLRLDGLPYADRANPRDSGVAVYFTYRKKQMCFACDRWAKVDDNMHAIALTIEALRGVARWGTGDMMEAAFTGFAALPAPMEAARPWRDVLGVAFDERDAGRITDCYRISRSKAHPDKGGTPEAFQAVDRAYEQAARELGFQP